MHHLFCKNQQGNELNYTRGLFIRDTFRPYKQFVKQNEQTMQQERKVVITCPQKLVGGTTLDLLFECAE